jgi:predicted ATPase
VKLTTVEVQGYRSLVDRVSVELGSGMNVIVGKNNCGKSNLLTAITLAMDPASEFSKARDTPRQMQWSVPRIALDFAVPGRNSPESTLLRYAQRYEEEAGARPDRTLASQNRVKLIVEYRSGVRQEYFQAAGTGGRRLKAEDEALQKLQSQFRKTVRYVLVRSGESLQSLLNGRFRDILQLVLREHLRDKVAEAEVRREKFISDLQGDLLSPLQGEIGGIVAQVFPEITSSALVPKVRELDETLADMQIQLGDAASTDLSQKGAGVRGGVLLALLNYLASQTKRSIVLAVEEPEAFLHPGGQEDLRDGLERLVEWSDVTLLATTHSPFIVSRNPQARIISVRKGLGGATGISDTASGADSRAPGISDLFRDPDLGNILAEVMDFSADGCRAVLVVEGQTDKQYLEIAAGKTGRSEVLENVKVVPAGGAERATLQAILFKNRVTVPVIVMLDHDDMGRRSAEHLVGLAGFNKKKDIISLVNRSFIKAAPDVESEDLWPASLHSAFLAEAGDVVRGARGRVGNSKELR